MCLACPTLSWERHDSLLCVTRHLYICYMIRWCGPVMCGNSPIQWWDTMWLHSYACVCLGICICATWLVDAAQPSVRSALFIVETWYDSLICVCVTGHCICATWVVDTGDAWWSCVWHALCILQTWLTPMCDSTPVYVWHDSSICVTWLVYDYSRLIHMCHVTRLYVCRDSFVRVHAGRGM